MSNRVVIEPHPVRIIEPKFGKCILCGQRKDKMVWVKDVGIVCPDHDAYALVHEIDDGYYSVQTVSRILATREEAEAKKIEMSKALRDARIAVGWRPESYFVKPLRELVGRRRRAFEVDEPIVDNGW
jgi:hypothetical protein